MADASGLVVCVACQEEFPEEDCYTWQRGARAYARCKGCAGVQKRFKRCLDSMDEETQQFMGDLDEAAKKQFLLDNKSVLGDKLKKAIDVYVNKKQQKEEQQVWRSQAHMLPKFMLEEKYAKAPEILQSILQRAEKSWDETKQCWLYADDQYSYSKAATFTETKTTEVAASSKHRIKHMKRAIEAGPDVQKHPAGKLDKGHERMLHTKHQLQSLLDVCESEEYQAMVPEGVRTQAKLAILEAANASAEYELTKQESWEGSTSEVIERLAKDQENLKKQLPVLAGFMKAADGALGKTKGKKAGEPEEANSGDEEAKGGEQQQQEQQEGQQQKGEEQEAQQAVQQPGGGAKAAGAAQQARARATRKRPASSSHGVDIE